MRHQRFIISFLSLSAAGLVGLLGYEGFSGEAYIPIKGDVPTIGFGTTEGVRIGDSITPEKAIKRAYKDIRKTESAIHKCVHVPLTQGEYDAFVSLSYNIGTSAFCNSTLVKKLNNQDYEGACLEIKRWIYVKGKPIQGLITRREKEYQICIGGENGH